MTQTVQPSSWATLSEMEKVLNQTEDNRNLLLSVFDSLSKLSEATNKLNYVIQRKKLEQILYQDDKEGVVSASRSHLIDDAASLQSSATAHKGEKK